MNKPGWLTYIRDAILFCVGAAIVLKQAGIGPYPYFEAPAGGPEITLVLIGALFCNGPLVLKFLAARSGTGLPAPGPPASAPEPPQEPLPAPSSGGS